MALSPNYGWAEPDNSSLVKNGAQDIRALGDAIDTSLWNVGYGQAGKNKIINGAFNVWQRGTTFSPATATPIYSADRFTGYANFSAGTYTVSQQAFTAGTAPVAGYESQYFVRHSFPTSGTISYAEFGQKIEDVRTFAGQTVTLSFWAKASSAVTSPTFTITQNFGSGGSGSVSTGSYAPTLSTSWTRYSVTVTLPSIAGKTIGTNNFLYVQYFTASVATSTVLDFWGWQLEYGSKATPFQTATGTLQGELAACQRYYFRTTGQAAASNDLLPATMFSSTSITGVMRFPVPMRTAATCSFSAAGDFQFVWSAGTSVISAANIDRTSSESVNLRLTSTGLTTNGGGYVAIASGTTKWLEASAEL
jgi:hypothetical protein